MARFPHTLLATAYFPPVSWFFALAQSDRVEVEACESYQKQSYRNRCRIYSAAGPEALVVPVVHAKGEKIPIRDVRIDYSEPWVRLHERAMTAAYNHSAFFEYYRDDLFHILEGQETFLFDLNWKLTEKLIELCGLRVQPSPTVSFLPPMPMPAVGVLPEASVTDLRALIQPKYRGESLLHRYGRETPYFQLFPAGGSFIPDLSVLDLLCAEGPNAISFLSGMKTIEVVAAIIRKGDRFFATQRGYGEWKDWWELPGGKMEPGETPEQALVREIREELDAEIRVDKYLTTIDWNYPKFHLTMHCYVCSLLTDALHLNEHEAARWLGKDEIHTVKWLPADELLLPEIVKELW